MTKDEIEKNINKYQEYISELILIENRILEILIAYKGKNIDQLKANDFRPGTFGRLLSSILTTKFFFHSTYQYVNHKEWELDYFKNILPKNYPTPNYLGHFISIDMGIRFYLFHSVYHQIETTYRVIQRNLKLKKGKPIEIVTKKLNLYDLDLIKLIDAIRNTIHNNGFYMPIIDKQEKEFSVTFNQKTFSFKENYPIVISTKDFLEIVFAQIELIFKVIQNQEVLNIPLIADMANNI
jgi:hypothetical protein